MARSTCASGAQSTWARTGARHGFAYQANFSHVVAVGKRILVSYLTVDGVFLVRSADLGVSWAPRIRLSPKSAPEADEAWLAWTDRAS